MKNPRGNDDGLEKMLKAALVAPKQPPRRIPMEKDLKKPPKEKEP